MAINVPILVAINVPILVAINVPILVVTPNGSHLTTKIGTFIATSPPKWECSHFDGEVAINVPILVVRWLYF